MSAQANEKKERDRRVRESRRFEGDANPGKVYLCQPKMADTRIPCTALDEYARGPTSSWTRRMSVPPSLRLPVRASTSASRHMPPTSGVSKPLRRERPKLRPPHALCSSVWFLSWPLGCVVLQMMPQDKAVDVVEVREVQRHLRNALDSQVREKRRSERRMREEAIAQQKYYNDSVHYAVRHSCGESPQPPSLALGRTMRALHWRPCRLSAGPLTGSAHVWLFCSWSTIAGRRRR